MALKIKPTNALAFYNRGISYDRRFDFAEAIENFSFAIQLD